MDRVALDIMRPLIETESKNRDILLIQDYFTKWVEAFPLSDEQAVTVAKVLFSEWLHHYGAPQMLHSEQGRNFESEVFQKMCTLFAIDKTHTTHTHGQCEQLAASGTYWSVVYQLLTGSSITLHDNPHICLDL